MSTIDEAMGVAQAKVDELSSLQNELRAHAKARLQSINENVDSLVKIIKREQGRLVSAFEGAMAEEEKRLAAETAKYEKTREELRTKSVDLGNMIEALC